MNLTEKQTPQIQGASWMWTINGRIEEYDLVIPVPTKSLEVESLHHNDFVLAKNVVHV